MFPLFFVEFLSLFMLQHKKDRYLIKGVLVKNKLLLSLIALCAFVQNAQGDCSTDCNICSHTTFVPRTMAQNSVLELALHDYYEYHKPECGDCPSWVSLEVTAPYYFKSTKNRKRLLFFAQVPRMYHRWAK